MTPTRAQVESVLVSRCKKSMAFVGFDSTTVNGTNANLNEPIATALLQMRKATEYLTNVTDLDLSTLTANETIKLTDLAELRLLKNIHGNADVVDIASDSQTERYSQFGDKILRAIDRLEKRVSSEYGIGTASLSAGKISHGFMAKVE